ncbi:MAG: hypothetical protein ACREXP_22635, partial [Steroidobacteraceae bacterium]
QEKIRLLAKLLGQIRQELIPEYVPQRVVMNVRPPAGAGDMRSIAGMNPEAIKDPVARERYKAAIRENSAKAVQNNRQATLRRMETEFARGIVGYLRGAAENPGALRQTVFQSIDQARLTPQERAEVMASGN